VAIRKRGDRYVLDWWSEGRRYRKFFDTKREADNYRTDIKKNKKDGSYVAPGQIPLLKEAAEAWLATRTDRTPQTYDQYRSCITSHLLPRFGELRLDQIKPEMIAAWRAELAQTGVTSKWRKPMARNTIRTIVRVLSSILDSAVRNGRLAGNPVKKLERPYSRARVGHREDDAIKPDEILNADEIRQLLQAAEPGRWRTLFTLGATSGAREGELLALRWSDVTFDGKPRIAIRRSLSWAKGPDGVKTVARFGPPKSEAGTRDVPIGPSVVLVLKAWKLQVGRNDLDLIFPHSDGGPLERSVLLKCGLWPTLKRAGLRHVTFHSLRHSFASGLIMHGAPVTEVSALLGHSDPAITLKVYSHWFKAADSGAASKYTAELFQIDIK
jgi:integrase